MLFFYKITPLIRLPASINQEFTYSFKTQLDEGDLVLVSFRRRKVLGIITQIISNPKEETYKIKSVLNVIEKKYLNKNQIKLFKELASYYWASLSLLLKTASPKKIISREKFLPNGSARGRFKITKKEIRDAKRLINFSQEKRTLLFFARDRFNIYYYLIAGIINSGGQVLFLVPDLLLLHTYRAQLENIFGTNRVAVLDKGKAGGNYYSNWTAIKSGKKSILLGTRSTVLANFKNLKLVIVEDAHDQSFKQWDQNPRYDARSIAKKFPDYFDCSVIFGSYCPSVSFYNQFKKQKAIFETTNSHAILTIGQAKKHIIDAREKNNFDQSTLITDQVIQKIQQTLAKKQTIFLGTSQKGSSGCYFCRDCGYIPKCPSCERNLYLSSQGELKCPVCGTKMKFPSRCPKCNNQMVKMIGLGIRKLYQEIQRLFPQFQVVLIDEEERKSSQEQKEKIALTLNKGIVVGNVSLLRLAKFNPVTGAVISINADKSLFLPDFTVGEKKYQEISQLLSKNYKLLSQTKYPKNRTTLSALARNYQKFYRRELLSRKRENLPPFTKLIKFSYRDISAEISKKTLEKLKSKLKNIENKLSFFNGPYPGYPEKVRKKYIYHLTIGHPPNSKIDPLRVTEIIDYCTKNKIIIDVDPVGLI
ncbi:MAG: primosomal protein N' [Patescibacteria group bacterium]|nr:primosomal protein N' [Patescibacteria group bacterium]